MIGNQLPPERGAPISILAIVSLLPFFVWSFLGGHKQVLFGFSTDHVATIIAFLASLVILALSRQIGSREMGLASALCLLLAIYCASIFRSTQGSDAIIRLVEHLVYIVITFAAALLFRGNLNRFVNLCLGCAAISASVVVVAAAFLGLGSWRRVTIPVFADGSFSYFPYGYESSSDPNVLSYFLYIGALLALYKWSSGASKMLFALLCVAGALTLSRSGFVGFFAAVLSYFSVLGYARVRQGGAGKLVIRVGGAVVLALGVIIVILATPNDLSSLIAERVADRGSNEDRIQRLGFALQKAIEDVPGLLLGNGVGYSRATVDPHLFYLSTVMDVGFIALCLMLGLLFWPAFAFHFGANSVRGSAVILSIVVFFLTVAFFYWHVRFYYFTMLVLFCFYLSFAGAGKAQSGAERMETSEANT